MSDAQWVEEDFGPVRSRYRLATTLHNEQTPFQSMEFVETELYGKMLLLDGIVQTTERDEFIYHEMMTHVPLMAHPNPRQVLIIGGGDGGILRETLRHPSVERAVLCEIDERVIEFSKQHLPTISDGAFDNPRAEIVIADGAEYLANSDATFDVIVVDSPDPAGPALSLFSEGFYKAVADRLNAPGIVVRQTGSTFLQPGELPEVLGRMRPHYEYAAAYVYAVPTYVGGLFSTAFCSNGVDPMALTENGLAARWEPLKAACRYYNPGLHVGAFRLPGYVHERVSP